jgi:hypothetical protein
MSRWSVAWLILVSSVSTGCRHLEKQINAKWPPRTDFEKPYAATQVTQEALKNFTDPPDLYVGVRGTDIDDHLPALLMAKVPEIKALKITTRPQELVFDADFDGAFESGKAQMKGRAIVHVAASLAGSRITLSPTFTRIVLSRVKYKKTDIPTDVVAILNAALERFRTNINGAIKDEVIDVTSSFVGEFDPKALAENQPNIRNVYGSPLKVNSGIADSALLIDLDGLHVLADVVNLPKAAFEEASAALIAMSKADPDEKEGLSAKANREARLSSTQRAVLDNCETYRRFAGAPAAADLIKACDVLETKLLAAQAVTAASAPVGPITEEELQRLHTEVKSAFIAKSAALGTQGELRWTSTAAAVSKSFLSEGVNALSTDTQFGLVYDVPKNYLHFKEELQTGPAPSLKCDDNTTNCDNECARNCDPGWTCAERGCPSDCGVFDVGCHAWKPVCEVLKATEKAGCQADQVRYRAQCEAGRGVCLIGCEARKVAEIAGCKLNQAWLDAWANKNVGDFQGTVAMEGTAVDFRIASPATGQPAFEISAQLDSITIHSSVAARGDVLADMEFLPKDLGHILCIARWNARLTGSVSSAINPLEIRATVAPDQESQAVDPSNTAKSLRLVLKMAPVDVPIKVCGPVPGLPGSCVPPIPALLAQNPHVGVVCAPAVVLGLTGELFGDIAAALKKAENEQSIFKDTFNQRLDNLVFPLVLPPLAVELSDLQPAGDKQQHQILLQPFWETNIVGYAKPKDIAGAAPKYFP